MTWSSDGRNGPHEQPQQASQLQPRPSPTPTPTTPHRDRQQPQQRRLHDDDGGGGSGDATAAAEAAAAAARLPLPATTASGSLPKAEARSPSVPAPAPAPDAIALPSSATAAAVATATTAASPSATAAAAAEAPNEAAVNPSVPARVSTPPPPPPAKRVGGINDPATAPPPPPSPPQPATGPADASAKLSSLSSNNNNDNVDVPMPDAPDRRTLEPGQAKTQPQDGQTPRQNPQQQQDQQQDQQVPGLATAMADQFAPSTPFTASSLTNLDQHAYMMMALASMSGAQPAMSPPPTVTPSQVTLPNPMDDDGLNGLGGAAHALHHAGADKALESFARIEFADSVFQMTTYAVIIGRDQRALQQARRDEKRAEEHRRRVEENASMGLPPPSPMQHDRSKFSKSYVSEEGGMLGPESDSEENGRPAKRRKTSTTGSSQNEHDESQENMISNRQYVSHTPGAAAVDLTSLRPSPYHIPFIGIHSPGPNIASKTKAISREHLKIAYNQHEGVFEAIPLHKNGFFCEDVHYKSDKVVLRCGDRLQIKDIDFRFIINGVERGRTGAEEFLEEEAAKKRHSHSGKEMSFDFEQSHGNGEMQDTSDELPRPRPRSRNRNRMSRGQPKARPRGR
ncbi:hypothetical protein CDD83_1850 [Cordyceps sp. RAO-2017]|nr:hypothetical protein CDD83_1850 [Cordyceps sp. RAO-2017]